MTWRTGPDGPRGTDMGDGGDDGEQTDSTDPRTDGSGSDDEPDQSYVEYRCTACGKGHPRNTPPCDRCGNMDLEPVTVRDVDVDEYLPETPGFPTRELVAAVAVVALVVAALALGAVPLGGDWTASVDPAAVEEAVVASVDAERSALGLASLSTDDRLAAAADRHNRDMIETGYFGPVSPAGEDLADRLARENASCAAPRESFARQRDEPPGSGPVERRAGTLAVDRWLDGRNGRSTLLWADAARIGVDARADGDGRLYVAVVTCRAPM